jgi:thiamine biosynthesis lipoprotein
MHSPMPLPQRYPKHLSNDIRRSVALMGTVVTIHVVASAETNRDDAAEREKAVERAFEWFSRVEECCTRFEAGSEVMQLTSQVGVPVRVSTLLYEAVQFALAVAQQSEGAFDPTVGYAMETRGFNREYRTGQAIRSSIDPEISVSYRDVRLDADRGTITLLRPVILDLGAVAKGLAVDLAARELRRFQNFAIDASGDLYLAGRNPDGERWSIGIRHPRRASDLIDSLRVSERAVCTSGDYERRSSNDNGHHILDPRGGSPANGVASVTVVAPNAMLADALATAAFVLGPQEGIRLFDRLGVDGLIVTPQLERYATRGMSDYH